MTEINVSCLLSDVDAFDLSASVAERGQNAGKETWENALDAAKRFRPIVPKKYRQDVKDFFKGYGAWDDAEIKAWSIAELDALVLQFAAGDLRELESLCPGDGLGDIDWEAARALSEAGTVSGRLWADDDGKLWIGLCD